MPLNYENDLYPDCSDANFIHIYFKANIIKKKGKSKKQLKKAYKIQTIFPVLSGNITSFELIFINRFCKNQ